MSWDDRAVRVFFVAVIVIGVPVWAASEWLRGRL